MAYSVIEPESPPIGDVSTSISLDLSQKGRGYKVLQPEPETKGYKVIEPETPTQPQEPSLLEKAKQGFKKGLDIVRPLAAIPGQVAGKAMDVAGSGVLGLMNLPISLGIDKAHRPLTRENFLPSTDAMTEVIKNALFQPDKESVNPFTQKGTPITPEWQQKLAHIVARGLKENLTPENIGATLVTGGAASAASAKAIPALRAMGIGFGGEALKGGVEKLQQGDTEGAILNSALGALMLGGASLGVDSTYRNTSGLGPGDISDTRRFGDFPLPKDYIQGQVRQAFVRPATGEIPIVGQRPLDIGQNLVLPAEAQSTPRPLEIPALPASPKEVPLAGQISFEGQEGIPSAMQAKEMVQAPSTQMGEKRIEVRSAGAPIRPEDLRAAVKVAGTILVGEHGETHADILERNGIDPRTVPHPDPNRGFVDVNNPDTLISRIDAQKASGLAGTADAGGLDSMDLPGAARTKLLREVEKGTQDAIPELRPDSVSKAQPPEDIQKVEEGIRGRTEGESEVQRQRGQETQEQETSEGSKGVEFRHSGVPLKLAREKATPESEGPQLFWMQSTGHMLPETRDYKTAKEVLGETGTGEPREPSTKGYDLDMAQKGFTKVIKDQGKVFVDVNASAEQLAKAKELAKSEGREVVSGHQLHAGIPAKVEEFGKKATEFFKTFQATSNNELSAQLLDGAETRARNDARAMRNELERNIKQNNPTIPKDKLEKLASAYEHQQFTKLEEEYTKQWAKQLSIFRAPDTRPFLTDPKIAPGDYKNVQVTPGLRLAVHPDYVPLMKSLLNPSQIRDSRLGNFLLQLEGGLKHSILAVDTFHMARVMWRQSTLMGKPSWNKGLSLLEYNDKTLADMVRNKEIDQSVADWAKQLRPLAELLQRNGLNVGRISEDMYGHWVDSIPGLGTKIIGPTRKWVFEKLSRGAMLEAAIYQFEKVKASNPTWTDTQVARKVARDINVNFGNIQRQGFLKNPALRDLAQIILLAPQWFEAGLRRDVMGTAQLGKAATGQGLGTLGKSVGFGILAGFLVNQGLNMVTRGKPTWENEEKDHKLDAFVPDFLSEKLGGKKGEGFWVSPLPENMAQFGEYQRQGKTPLEAGARIFSNKLSPPGRAAEIAIEGRDYSGRRLSDTERVSESLAALEPFPIPVSRIASKTPGAAQRQVFSAVGVKLEPAGRKERLDFMTLDERLDKYNKDKKAKPPTYEGKERGAGTASVENVRLGKEIANSLPKTDRNWLESRGLILSGYSNTVKYKGVALPLSEVESEKLSTIMKEEYSKGLEVIKKRYDDIPSERGKTAFFSDVMESARAKAHSRMSQEAKTSSSTVELDRKKYKTKGLGPGP